MILYTFKDCWFDDVERVAARMVEFSMAAKTSACAIIKGIPLVTYPNDCRTPGERIKNLVLAFSDGWVRSQMKNDPLPEPDTRFDPRFECEICKISAAREEVLREILAALASVAREKLPGDGEIAALASAADTILRTTKDQRDMVEQFRELLKP
jgi:hypothetical protein